MTAYDHTHSCGNRCLSGTRADPVGSVPCSVLRGFKSTHNLGKRQNKKTNPIELWLKEIAGTLAGKLKINEYKRLQLEADLRTADMPMTPEQYIANCIVKSGFVALFAIPLFFVSKLLALIALGASVLMYVNESRKVSNRIKERRRKIEADLRCCPPP